MNPMNEDHFFDLVMKSIAGQATDSETRELEALISANPDLQAELDRLRADVRLAKEAVLLVDAVQAKGAELPGYARERLQARVKETFGQQKKEAEEEREAKAFAWDWKWFLGLAATAAVVALIAVSVLMAPPKTQIEVAFLDLAGPTRSAGTNESVLFLETLEGATATNISSLSDLKAWEQFWPAKRWGYQIKVIYDRALAEIRVVGRGRGREFSHRFSVGAEPRQALNEVQTYVKTETAK
jgi:hypothetical protein